jgi:hypothetical protein
LPERRKERKGKKKRIYMTGKKNSRVKEAETGSE